MALVFLVIFFLISSGLIFAVSGSMSENTGLPPQYKTQFAEAAKVIGEVIASSPFLRPAARQAICKAAVPLDTATAYLAPAYLQRLSSNSFILGPCVSQSEFKTFMTSLISFLSRHCLL